VAEAVLRWAVGAFVLVDGSEEGGVLKEVVMLRTVLAARLVG
jgi:hypothetical protein